MHKNWADTQPEIRGMVIYFGSPWNTPTDPPTNKLATNQQTNTPTHQQPTTRPFTKPTHQESNNLATDQNKRLLNFSYIVSHNLRSHASNIKTILSFLQEAPDPEERQMMLNHLETVATRLDETLHNLNEVVSIQQNENLQIETLELNEYIQKTLLLLQAQIAFKKANIRCDIPTGVAVQYNPAYLESILFNFVSNALKYSHPDRIPDISLHFFDTAGCGVLQISDNGMGIDLEKNGDKLFGMYKTFHGNADAKGLGLFISKNQIEAMGGSVEVESKVNVGTTFTIYFK